MPEICQNGVDVKYNVLVVQADVEWTADAVEHGVILMCPFYCFHYQVDMLSVHLSGISGDIWNGDNVY